MDENRRMEIALLVAEDVVMQKGLPNPQTYRQDVGNMAKRLSELGGKGITTRELMDFHETFMPKIYGRMFGYERVGIKAENRRGIILGTPREDKGGA